MLWGNWVVQTGISVYDLFKILPYFCTSKMLPVILRQISCICTTLLGYATQV